MTPGEVRGQMPGGKGKGEQGSYGRKLVGVWELEARRAGEKPASPAPAVEQRGRERCREEAGDRGQNKGTEKRGRGGREARFPRVWQLRAGGPPRSRDRRTGARAAGPPDPGLPLLRQSGAGTRVTLRLSSKTREEDSVCREWFWLQITEKSTQELVFLFFFLFK